MIEDFKVKMFCINIISIKNRINISEQEIHN